MLEAHIFSPRGSLYYAGEADPYDLELLWQHVRDAGSADGARDVRLELVFDDDRIGPWMSTWVQKIAASGVRVEMLFTQHLAAS